MKPHMKNHIMNLFTCLGAASTRSRILFVLIAMQDEGLVIQPTHRLIGNLGWFDIDAFTAAIGANGDVNYVNVAPEMAVTFAAETGVT